MARVGVIGLGVMGTPMARNLLKGGHEVTVFARRAEAMAPLAAAGARTSTSPAEAAAVSDVIITMVLDTQAVESVVLGPGGIIEGARAGSIVVDHSTIEPADVLMTGFGASRMLEVQAPKMIARNFEAKVESRLHHKDIQIVLDMARALGLDLPGSAAAARVIAALQARGGATRDTAAVFEVLANP